MGEIYEGNSKSGFIKSMPLEDWQAHENRLRTVEAALRALVSDEDAGLVYAQDGHENMMYECAYCDNQSADTAPFEHAPDCPILAGRRALGEGDGGR